MKPFWLSWQMISANWHYHFFMFPSQKHQSHPWHLPLRGFMADLITSPVNLCSKIALKSTHFPILLPAPWTKPPPLPSLEYCSNLLTGLLIFTKIPLQSILYSTSRMTFIKHMSSPNSTVSRMSQNPIWWPMRSSMVQPYLPLQPYPVTKKTTSHPTLLF